MAFVIAKTKMSGKAAASEDWFDRLGENPDEAARIFAMSVAAHRGLIQSDLGHPGFHQLYEFLSTIGIKASVTSQRFL